MTDKTDADEQLYDILVPPGVPRKILYEIPEKFNVKVVERTERLQFANMVGDERNLIAFRGKLGVVKEVEKYMIDKLNEFIGK
jgi:hypothetical protein